MISKFRLCCNPTLSFKTNLADVLLTTSFFILSSRPQNIACHNLCTSHTPPKFYRHVLGLGLKFCPRPAYTTSPNIVKQTTSRFRKDIYTKVLFCHLDNDWNEKQLYIRDPEWDPPSDNIPIEIRARISHFNRVLLASFKHRKVGSNLSTPQQQCLTALRNNKDLLVIPSDKNLGPVILDRNEYIRRCFQEHLLTDNYEELSEHEANTFVQHTYTLLTKFINDHANSFTEPDLTFLLRSLKVDDPFAYFYALAKVHKKPWVTRPIVSVAGSITHGIGRWLDQQLQPIVRQLPTYLKSSFQLKTDLDQLPDVNSNHMSFFTGDIVAMYPSIDIPDALRRISQFLQTSPLAIHCPKIAIISALEIIMTRNCFRFGNTYWLQLDGTAMGTPPAPAFAMLYYAIFEIDLLKTFPEQLRYLKRYIDDQFGIWVHHPNPYIDTQLWNAFQHAQQTCCSLTWKFSTLSKQVTFLDLQVILESNRIIFKIYEKELNLYLFIPPSSAHSPNVQQSLVSGGIKRILDLTTRLCDQKAALCKFFKRLCIRGYSQKSLLRLFRNGLTTYAATPTKTSPTKTSPTDSGRRIFLHLPYHPRDPQRKCLQAIFRRTILQPKDEPHFTNLQNLHGGWVEVERMIVAYHRQPNLRTLLFPRQAEGRCPDATPASAILSHLRETQS